jgi:hypothetical protein
MSHCRLKIVDCRLVALVAAMAMSCLGARAYAGSIKAQVQADEPIRKVWAIQRDATAGGTYNKPFEGKVEGDRVVIEGLPVGRFDLKFETESGGVVEGWDASVPRSTYEEEQPLGDESKEQLLKKMTSDNASGFADDSVILDMQGNIENVAILLHQLRTRMYVTGAGPVDDTWIWRVDRWQWELSGDTTWVPWQERPSYALLREKLPPKTWSSKRVVFARHLGGIALKAESPDADRGIIRVPRPAEGVTAVEPDGTPIKPIVLKANGGQPPAVTSQTTGKE